MVGTYLPDAGDLIWLDFDPQAGREQAGRRPAVVLSFKNFNVRSSVAFVCPITSKMKGYATEVVLPPGLSVHGAVLCAHMRSVDWRARDISYIGKIPNEILISYIGKIPNEILEEVRELVGSIAGILP